MPRGIPRQKKLCRRCESEWAVSGEKFCKECRKRVLAELEANGYLCETKIEKPAINEHRDRSQLDFKAMGGAADQGSDGDEW